MQKMHITIIQLALLNRIIYVTGYYWLIFLKQLSHLSLRQPHRLIL